MRCLTCGKRIHPQMQECPNCGAMIPVPETGGKSSAGKAPDSKSVLAPRQSSPPPFRRAQPPPLPDGDSGDELEDAERPSVPSTPAWTQYIVPIIIALWLAFRMFGPNIQRFLDGKPWEERESPAATAVAAPELRRVLMCEGVEQGQPVGARNRFSKSRDRAATVFTAWTGDSSMAKIQFNWRAPGGNVLAGSQQVENFPGARTTFMAYGELPLGEFTEAGSWSIEVKLNGEIVASQEFMIEQ